MNGNGRRFAEGQRAIWVGTSGQFRREVQIIAVRRFYLTILGESPSDGQIVYDIHDPVVIKGIVYGIPGDQLDEAPA
jgi:hypothetical protein